MIIRLGLILSLILTANFTSAEKLELDTEQSKLIWTGKKITENHIGTVNLKSGYVEVEDNQVVGGEFLIDMNTIKNTDIENKTYSDKLTKHLKSPDFFAVEEFPEGKFVIKRVKDGKIPAADALVVGELTIKDQTHFVTLPAQIAVTEENALSTSAKTTIDRTKWDIRYNSKKWIDPAKLGDKLILDDVDIELKLITKQAA